MFNTNTIQTTTTKNDKNTHTILEMKKDEDEDILSLPPALPPSSNVFFTDKWKVLTYEQLRNPFAHFEKPSLRFKPFNILKVDPETSLSSLLEDDGTTSSGHNGVGSTPSNEKRRESIITNDRGVVLKKICAIKDCDKIVTVRVDRYVATKSGKLCKGNMNTKRLFIKDDVVDVINPINSKYDKSCIVSRKQPNGKKDDMYSRVLQDYAECLSFRGNFIQMFRSHKEGLTKTDNKVCYLIKPTDKTDIWIEDPHSVKDFENELPFNEDRSILQPIKVLFNQVISNKSNNLSCVDGDENENANNNTNTNENGDILNSVLVDSLETGKETFDDINLEIPSLNNINQNIININNNLNFPSLIPLIAQQNHLMTSSSSLSAALSSPTPTIFSPSSSSSSSPSGQIPSLPPPPQPHLSEVPPPSIIPLLPITAIMPHSITELVPVQIQPIVQATETDGGSGRELQIQELPQIQSLSQSQHQKHQQQLSSLTSPKRFRGDSSILVGNAQTGDVNSGDALPSKITNFLNS